MSETRIKVWVTNFKGRPYPMLQWIDADTGARKSESAKTADPDAVDQARSDLEYRLNHDLHHRQSKMPWERFREIYEEEKLAGARKATLEKAGYVFDSFQDEMKPKTLGKITERTLSQYAVKLREKGFTPATIHGHLAYLRAALRWAADQKFILAAPKFVMPKLPKKKLIRKITAEEFERLVDEKKVPNVYWRAYIATAWYSGMRRNEMLDLAWDHANTPRIDFKEKKILIPAAYNKSDEDQWPPLHPELAEILEALPNKTGFLFPFRHVPREVSRRFTTLARGLGLKITLHDLRRSFGSRYAAVVTAPVLQRLMRHADIKTTLRFYTNVDDGLADAILKA